MDLSCSGLEAGKGWSQESDPTGRLPEEIPWAGGRTGLVGEAPLIKDLWSLRAFARDAGGRKKPEPPLTS